MSKSHASSFADLSCWEPQHGAFFAVVTDQNKIRIFDTRTNEQVQDLSLPLQLSTVYSSLHWSQPTHNAPKKQKERKVQHTGASYIVGGTTAGKAIVWNAERGEVINEFTLTNKQPIVGLTVTPNNHLVATSKPNQLLSCSLASKDRQVTTNKLASDDLTGMSHANGSFFAVGFVGSTRLYETNTNQQVLQLQSHSTLGAKRLQILQDTYLITSSPDDRFVNMYDITKEPKGPFLKPKSVISVESNIVTTDIQMVGEQVHLLVVTQNGNLLVFELNLKKKTQKAAFVIKSSDAKSGSVLTAKFDSNELVIASGSRLNPNFTRVTYTSQDKLTFSGDVELASIASQSKPQSQNGTKTNQVQAKLAQFQTLKKTKDVSVLGPSNMEAPGARYRQAFAELLSKTNEDSLTSAIPDAIVQEDDTLVPKIKITSTLVQALKSNDRLTIHKCLDQTDVDLIHATVRELKTAFAIALLEILIERLQDDAEHIESDGKLTSTLVAWIRAILLLHTASIIASKSLINKLSPLYQSINHRLSNFTALLELSGRLDLLLSLAGYSQVGLNAAHDDFKDDYTKPSEEEEKSKLRTYDVTEDESDDDFDDVQHVHGGKGRGLENMGYDVMGDDEDREDEEEEAIEKRQGWFLETDGDMDSDEEDLIRQLDDEEKRLGVERKVGASEEEESEDESEQDEMVDDEDMN